MRKPIEKDKRMHHATRRQWLAQMMIDNKAEIEELERKLGRLRRKYDALVDAFDELCEIHPPFE